MKYLNSYFPFIVWAADCQPITYFNDLRYEPDPYSPFNHKVDALYSKLVLVLFPTKRE